MARCSYKGSNSDRVFTTFKNLELGDRFNIFDEKQPAGMRVKVGTNHYLFFYEVDRFDLCVAPVSYDIEVEKLKESLEVIWSD